MRVDPFSLFFFFFLEYSFDSYPHPSAAATGSFDLKVDFQEYCSSFTDDALNLLADSDFNFDASKLGLPEFNFGALSASSLGHVVDFELESRHLDEFQLDSNFVSATLNHNDLGKQNILLPVAGQIHPPYHAPTDISNSAKRSLTEGLTVEDTEQEDPVTTRRKRDDAVIVFSADPTARVAQKQRRPFNPSRKREVALNRVTGACILCKLRKDLWVVPSIHLDPKGKGLSDFLVQLRYTLRHLHQKN